MNNVIESCAILTTLWVCEVEVEEMVRNNENNEQPHNLIMKNVQQAANQKTKHAFLKRFDICTS